MSKLTIINATASSQYSNDFKPDFAIDGIMSTRWASLNKTGTQYIQFDLGETYTIENIKCACGSAYQPETFDFQVSEDGTNFTTHLVGLTINTTDTLQEFILTEVDTRYIRLLMKSTKSANFYELKEFEVYGREPITATLTSIELTKLPNKLVYYVGDLLDLSGIEVIGSYDDDTTKEITVNNSMVSGFDSSINISGQIITININEFIVNFTIDIIKNKGEGKQIAIKFTEDLIGDVGGNESAFAITGKEHKYVNGSLLDKVYTLINVEPHPTEPRSILLTLDWWSRFNNVIGDLTISYNATKGNLQGAGGAVESFEVSFFPEDLVLTPNPNVEEYISVAPSVSATFLPVEYHKAYETETITVSPVTVTATLTHTSIINP